MSVKKIGLALLGLVAVLALSVGVDAACYSYKDSKIEIFRGEVYCGGNGAWCIECPTDSGSSTCWLDFNGTLACNDGGDWWIPRV